MTVVRTTERRPGGFVAFWLVATAAVNGAVVMAVEVLGARMLSVGFGASTIVWSAMISVTLLSLAIGYFVGGCLADRFPRPGVLYGVVMVTALLLVGCPHTGFVLRWCYHAFGLRGGALASSAAVFLLPLGLLGMVSPYVIRLLCASRQRAGITAGGVYAISTVGSVAGTLLTALWLIPSFGTSTGFRAAAVCAGAMAAAGLVGALGRRGGAVLVIPVALAFVPGPARTVGRTYVAPDGEPVEIIAARESAYGHIAVLRKADYNLLVVDGIVQTGVPQDLATRQHADFLAANYFQELLPYMVDDPRGKRVLIIGLAGGMTATMLKGYAMAVDAVDLDGRIIAAAREHFGFTGGAVVADGRRFLEDCRDTYDFCVIDTYAGDVFPFHLASVEAFRAAKAVLAPEGVLAMNYIGAPGGQAFACLCHTLRQVFAHVRAIKGEFSDDVQTITLFAADRPIEFNQGWLDYRPVFFGADPIAEAVEQLTVTPDLSAAFVLTDDYNPIDFLRESEAVRWRARTAHNIGEAALF